MLEKIIKIITESICVNLSESQNNELIIAGRKDYLQ